MKTPIDIRIATGHQFEYAEAHTEIDIPEGVDPVLYLNEKYHNINVRISKPLPKRPIGQRPKDEIDQLSHLDGDHYEENGI